MNRAILALTLAASLVLVACGGGDTAVEARLRSVDASEFATLIDDAPEGLVILDVRTPEEFGEARISDAVNIDFYETSFRSDLDALDKDVPYAIYCRSGNRSGQTLSLMEELGFENVTDLSGGIVSWYEAGYPIEG